MYRVLSRNKTTGTVRQMDASQDGVVWMSEMSTDPSKSYPTLDAAYRAMRLAAPALETSQSFTVPIIEWWS